MADTAAPSDSRKYRAYLIALAALLLAGFGRFLTPELASAVVGLAFAYMLGNVGASYVAGRPAVEQAKATTATAELETAKAKAARGPV